MNSYIVGLTFSFFNYFLLFITKKLQLQSVIHFKKISLLPVLLFLFLFFIPISPELSAQRTELSQSREGISVNQSQFNLFLSPSIIIFILIVVFFIVEYGGNKKFLILKTENILLLFFSYSLLSALFSFNLHASAIWILKIFFCLTIYFVFSRLIFSQKYIRFLFYGFISIVFFQASLALLQFVFGGLIGLPFEDTKSFFPLQLQSGYFRAVGTLSHPNKLSLFMAMLLPFFIVGKFSSSIFPFLCYLGITLCLSIPLLALSRWGFATTLFSLVLSVLILLYILPINMKTILEKFRLELSSILLVFIVLIIFQPTVLPRYTTFSVSDLSFSGRIALIKQSFFIIEENPLFGIGPGNFVTFFINYDYTPNNLSERFLAPVHNLYLLIASEIGIIGLLFFLLFILNIIFLAFKEIKTQRKRPIILFYIAIFISVLTFLFNGLWELRQFTDRSALLFFTCLGILSNLLVHKKVYQ